MSATCEYSTIAFRGTGFRNNDHHGTHSNKILDEKAPEVLNKTPTENIRDKSVNGLKIWFPTIF